MEMRAKTNSGRSVCKFLALVGVLVFVVVIDVPKKKRRVESVIKEDEYNMHIKNMSAVFVGEGKVGLRAHQEPPRNIGATESFSEDTTTTIADGTETEDHTADDAVIEDKHDKEEAVLRTNITVPNVLLIGVQKGGTSAVSY